MMIGLLTNPGVVSVAQAASTPPPKASPLTPVRGLSVTIKGRISTRVVRPIQLQRKAGSKWVRLATGKTTSKGAYSFRVSSSWSSAKLRVVASKAKVRKKTYPRLVSSVATVNTVTVTPTAPMPQEKFTVSQSLNKKGSRPATLQRRAGSKWVTIAKTKSQSSGSVRFTASLSSSANLRVVAPKATVKGKRLPKITLPTFRVSTAKQSAVMSLPSSGVTGQALVAQVRFLPVRAGRAVELQQYTGSQWVRVASGVQDTAGRAKLGVAPKTAGTLQFRAVAAAYRGAPASVTVSAKATIADGTPAPSIVLGSLSAAVTGESYQLQLTAVGGTAPLLWSATGLPDGMQLSQGGELSGVPASPGTYSVQLTVTDATGATAKTTVQLVVDPVVGVDTTTLPDGIAGQYYEAPAAASGGTPSYTWDATGLPTGLTISADGTISGATDATGDFTVELTVTDAKGKTATTTVPLRITAALSLTTEALASGATVGAAYESAMVASGGLAPYSWSATGLPSGITINTLTGVISGTPSQAGSFPNISVTVTDDNGYTATKPFALTVSVPYAITTTSLPSGVVGTSYTKTLTAAGGSEPYTWASTTLPAGLSLSDAGVISGTPTQVGTTDVTITVTDSGGATAQAILALTVAASVHITTTDLPNGVVGTTYAETTLTAADGNSASYAWSSTTLPAGLTLSTAGTITGTPTEAGTFKDVKVTVTDTDGATAEATYTITISPAVHITTTNLSNGVVGASYSATTLSAADGTPGYTWHSDSLPIGLSLSSDGKLSGTPTAADVYTVKITVTDHTGKTAEATYSVTIAPAVHITTTSLPDGIAGTSYPATTLTAADGGGSYHWQANNLPGGLSINADTGVISGTAHTAGGPIQATITVTDAVGTSDSKTFQITITPAVHITTTDLPSGVVGTGYSATMSALDGAPGYSWTSSTLPQGLSIDATTGKITGTPTQAGTFGSVTITATDQNGAKAEATYTITIAAAIHITTTSLPNGVSGTDYSATVEAAAGAPGYGWTSTGLPGGLVLNSSTGAITGNPYEVGTFDAVKITATDRNGATAEAVFTITIAPAVHITTTLLPDAVLNEAYPETALEATGGTGPYTWSATGLPAGVSVNTSTGVLSGIPTESGPFNALVTVTDANHKTAEASLSFTVHPELAITTAGLPTAVVGEQYSVTLAGLGGNTPYTWAVADLPHGLTLDTSTGAITGTPTVAGSVDLSVTLTDKNARTATTTLALTVRDAVHVTMATLPSGVVGTTYSGSISAGGGTAPYSWDSSTLPAGLRLSEDGALSGTPTIDGTTPVTFTVTDSHGTTATADVSITIVKAVHITTTELPSGVVDTSYPGITLSAADGNSGDYTWKSDTLPAGLSLSTAGKITGTPTSAGTFAAVKVTVTDAAGKSAEATFSMVIAPAVHITTASLPNGVVGTTYTETTLSAAGGNGSNAWSSTTLPDGLTLSEAGVLSGTPTTDGTTAVTFTVTDAAGKTAHLEFSIVIAKAVHITTTDLPAVEAGDAYSVTLAAAGGTPGYTWASTALPDGLTLSEAGVLSGTPSAEGTTAVTFTVTDTKGKTAARELSITVTAAAHLTSTSLSIGVVGGDYTSTLTADGGTAPYTITAATLPDGLTLSDGVISGTPTAAVLNTPVELTVTDHRAKTSTTTLDLTVVQPKTVSAGISASCAITPTGGVECWGANADGQLGDGTNTTSTYPVKVTGLDAKAISVTISLNHACALLSTGKVECWGANASGQLGDGTNTSSAKPVEVATIDSAVSISAGSNFTCATLQDGTASCWGFGTYGQIGNGSSVSVAQPTPVSGLTKVMDVETGGSHACALTTDGTVSCWGRNGSRQIGAGGTDDVSFYNSPVAVPDVSAVVSLSAHMGSHTCVATSGGAVKCWGNNPQYQLGSTSPGTSGTALTVDGITDAVQVIAGGAHSCAINAAGTLRCWGANTYGQLGAGSGIGANSATPVTVAVTDRLGVTEPVATAAAGSSHTCAGTTTGTLACWGSNQYGQLGNGTNTNADTPTAVVGFNVGTLAADEVTVSPTEVGMTYADQQLSATGGVAPYTWTATDLPAGLTLSSDGILAGTPTEAGTTETTFTVTDLRGKTAATTTSITTIAAVRITTSSLTATVVDTAFAETTLAATSGSGSYTWSATNLPTGLSLDSSTGVLSGTPTVPGGYSDTTFTVTDTIGGTAQATLALPITWEPGNTNDVLSLSTQNSHVCGLTNTGGVKCWGSNSYGQLGDGTTTSRSTATAVIGLDAPVKSVTAGTSHTCAITQAGGLRCWGYNSYGQLGAGGTTNQTSPVTVPGLTNVTAVAVGTAHTCALIEDGSVKCWGAGVQGQLGDGKNTASSTPVDTGLTNAVAISAGTNFSCAVLGDGTVTCWGMNTFRSVGDGTTTSRAVPTAVVGVTNATSISSGALHSCVVTGSGGIQCWGRNLNGQLGNGSTATSSNVVSVSNLPGTAISVTAGGSHSCALLDGGSVSCWGSNGAGQFGDGTTTSALTPTDSEMGAATQVVAGGLSTCAMNVFRTVSCWGSNNYGQVGNGRSSIETAPLSATNLTASTSKVTTGQNHTCVITASGTVQCWGNNIHGELGNQTTTASTSPVTVLNSTGSALTGVTALGSSANSEFNCAVATGGAVYCWGYNEHEELGDGSEAAMNTTDSTTAVPVTDLGSGATSISVGLKHSCVVTDTGTVKCWGANDSGQLGDGTYYPRPYAVEVPNLDHVTAVTAGAAHTCALIDDGTVKCWGDDYYGELGDGANSTSRVPVAVQSLSGVTAISAGWGYTCAVTNGAVKCWGNNNYGQVGNASTTTSAVPVDATGLSSGVTAISAGYSHVCALSSDGSIRCWGHNASGQLGVGDATDRTTPTVVATAAPATQISAGTSHTCATTSNATVQCWGGNFYGQLGLNTTLYPDPQTVLGILP
jgi:alpha-tubulin suppressor-like RCC1 family protein